MVLKEWNKALIWEAKVLMDKKYYSYDQAMNRSWGLNYKSIMADEDVDVSELRELYWKDGAAELERYTEEIIGRYR
ncbi:hypothetical protein PM10SUCC1_19240 [Propionigenium maris DSM 9537]|uniref:Uncharacterized protein n=1 Tax=Propionigenium maris DSM 9537 TaxID=1123000 RepID=A0A9W6GLM0_9FUSO|nr:hypothetical protein [Propionigenium maris]GLI56410.1 hypothetical protein PM10SUCC1_19240 [Propionigenium maris DSM 9537]